MKRLGRIPLLVLLSGALLLAFGLRAQENEKQGTPADKQQDNAERKKAISRRTKRKT